MKDWVAGLRSKISHAFRRPSQHSEQSRGNDSPGARPATWHEGVRDTLSSLKGKFQSGGASTQTDPLRCKYEVSDTVLGRGAFAEVRSAKDRATGKQWAVLFSDKSKLDQFEVELLLDEVELMKDIKHPNIVRQREFFDLDDYYCIVMEQMDGGELFDRIVNAPEGHYTEKNACNVITSIICALVYLHGLNIAHMDLKPENLLLADKSPDAVLKICDFGFATKIPPGEMVHSMCGSPGYVAPEIVLERGSDVSADMWSLGVVVYTMLTGIPPFLARTDQESFKLTVKGHYDPVPLEAVSESARDLVAKMLVFNPKKRITAKAALQHPWIQGGASGQPLGQVKAQLASMLVRRKWKKAGLATIATNRMMRLGKMLQSAKEAQHVLQEGDASPLTLPPPNEATAADCDPLRAKYNVSDQILGRGAYAEVKSAVERSTGTRWAVLFSDKSKLDQSETVMLLEEVELMKEIRHPNIVQQREFFDIDGFYCIVMELMDGGELFDRIVDAPEGHYTEKAACNVVTSILCALEYLHSRNIAHMDLKPENLLLVDKSPDAMIKVADFGFATKIPPGEKCQRVCGSPGYIAPEVVLERGSTVAADMFSMGVVLYTILTGIPPFMGRTDQDSFRKAARGHYDLAPLRSLSQPAQDLVAKMLQFNPNRRITAKAALQHPWVQGGASGESLEQVRTQIASMLVRRKWKKAGLATMATNRMLRLSSMLQAAKVAQKEHPEASSPGSPVEAISEHNEEGGGEPSKAGPAAVSADTAACDTGPPSPDGGRGCDPDGLKHEEVEVTFAEPGCRADVGGDQI